MYWLLYWLGERQGKAYMLLGRRLQFSVSFRVHLSTVYESSNLATNIAVRRPSLSMLSHEPGRFFSFSIQNQDPPSAANPLHPTMLRQPCLEKQVYVHSLRPITKPPQLAVSVARPDPCYPNLRRNIVHSSLNTPMRYAHGRALDKALITRNCLSP